MNRYKKYHRGFAGSYQIFQGPNGKRFGKKVGVRSDRHFSKRMIQEGIKEHSDFMLSEAEEEARLLDHWLDEIDDMYCISPAERSFWNSLVEEEEEDREDADWLEMLDYLYYYP